MNYELAASIWMKAEMKLKMNNENWKFELWMQVEWMRKANWEN